MSLTPDQLAALATEITTDPLTLGLKALAEAGNDSGCLAILNTPGNKLSPPQSWTKSVVVYRAPSLLKWGASGPRATIEAASATVSAIQAASLIALDMFKGSVDYLDLSDPQINGSGGYLQNLESAGVITTDQLGALIAMGTAPATRAEVLFGSGVVLQLGDISMALRGN